MITPITDDAVTLGHSLLPKDERIIYSTKRGQGVQFQSTRVPPKQ